jgi:hypothetical protein
MVYPCIGGAIGSTVELDFYDRSGFDLGLADFEILQQAEAGFEFVLEKIRSAAE